ncbi:vWA domain-containing protein [Hyphomonas sp.]|uniref:vWA domain-containing protein n=1 Tax=Hyphomonas sp. TaxID=87 RepID=UPI001BCB05B0|nr:vWA domain-containing protein [Hyphomonas sp.]
MTGGEIAPPDDPKPQPEAQAGLLTAGDYDDVLNPDLYKAYLDKVLQGELANLDLPYVDANQRIAIRVVDRLGKPVPLAEITLKTGDGKDMFPLRTGANGITYLYPQYDVLAEGMNVTVTARGKKTGSQTVSGELIASGGELVFEIDGDRTAATKLDLLLTLDATGSMGDEMAYLQKEIEGILDRVKTANPGLDIRAGLIVYRDKGDEYVVRDFSFTTDIASFKADLHQQSAGGGGDFPEAMKDALQRGLGFEWRPDAVRVNLLVADAPPHKADLMASWDAALVSRTRGIHIVPLAASGVDKTAEFLMRGMGQITGGRYLFLTDDSGIGNPHAEPTVDCYVVTRLDQLVTRVLSSLVSGERIEPEGEDVIRTVGSYRAGLCKVEELSGE